MRSAARRVGPGTPPDSTSATVARLPATSAASADVRRRDRARGERVAAVGDADDGQVGLGRLDRRLGDRGERLVQAAARGDPRSSIGERRERLPTGPHDRHSVKYRLECAADGPNCPQRAGFARRRRRRAVARPACDRACVRPGAQAPAGTHRAAERGTPLTRPLLGHDPRARVRHGAVDRRVVAPGPDDVRRLARSGYAWYCWRASALQSAGFPGGAGAHRALREARVDGHAVTAAGAVVLAVCRASGQGKLDEIAVRRPCACCLVEHPTTPFPRAVLALSDRKDPHTSCRGNPRLLRRGAARPRRRPQAPALRARRRAASGRRASGSPGSPGSCSRCPSFMDWYAGSGVGVKLAVIGWHTGMLGKLVFFVGLAVLLLVVAARARRSSCRRRSPRACSSSRSARSPRSSC